MKAPQYKWQVLRGDIVPGHAVELLKEFDTYTDAYYFGLNEAKGYCQGKERPHVAQQKIEKTVIMTPTDFYIFIREVEL